MNRKLFCSLIVSLLLVAPAAAQSPRFEFNRMVAHWSEYGKPGYLEFIAAARPQVAQLGFYGAHYWSLAHTKAGGGYPAHFPLVGLKENGDWFEEKNRELHKLGVKVVGHFNVKFLMGDPDSKEGPRGFFKFYRDLWDEKELGPKPVADPLDLLEKNADGTPIIANKYGVGGMAEYWGCLNNPAWQAVLKAWCKRGIERGVDGYIANYFYRHDCHCQHCVAGFKAHLASRYKPAELKKTFDIADLDKHQFSEIVCWHKPEESTPLKREMLEWSQTANKLAFDKVLIEYGRSLKPDLLVAQWNHLSDFSQINGDERCLLPSQHWGRGEDYLWYSTGASACYTDLAAGHLGEGTLQARYIRGAFDDKPFTLGKYEHTRLRTAIAELAANGGAPMGFYTRFTDPASEYVIVKYYQFLARYDELYHANRSQAEVLLLYPRSRVHQGDVASVAAFKQLGKRLLNEHVLFDVVPDEIATSDIRARYQQVLDVERGPDQPVANKSLSRFDLPLTVRVSLSKPEKARELTLHLVNYNRVEPDRPKSAGRGIQDEQPLAVMRGTADLVLPGGATVDQVEFITPEDPEPVPLKFKSAAGRLKVSLPRFLVYGVARVKLKP